MEIKPVKNLYTNNKTFKGYKEAMLYARFSRFPGIHLNNSNIARLEGIQKGLKTFEGLNMKQIAFALTDLHAITMTSGCKNHCLHCYGNSQPNILRAPFEVFKQVTDDLSVLRKRLGYKPVGYNGKPYADTYFDSDSLNAHIFDKDGNKYDAVDLGNMMHKATGYKYVFDTNGWSRHDKEKQKIAEDYVQKLLKDDNYKNCSQINISINPFNPKYVRAIRNGYNPNDYRILIPVSEEYEAAQNARPEALKKAEADYDEYIRDTANTLLTFAPLLKKGKLGVIQRVVSDDVKGMDAYKENAFRKTSEHILSRIYVNLMFDCEEEKKYVKSPKELDKLTSRYSTLLGNISQNLFSSGRMERFYKINNGGSLNGIDEIDANREFFNDRFEALTSAKKISAAKLAYLKIIDSEGKLYLYDNYHMIPTDIQFNFGYKANRKPFSLPIQDFVLTSDMIDLIA